VDAEQAGRTWPPTCRASGRIFRLFHAGDITSSFWIAAGFSTSTIVAVTLFWWLLSGRPQTASDEDRFAAANGLLVPDHVMEKAEDAGQARP